MSSAARDPVRPGSAPDGSRNRRRRPSLRSGSRLLPVDFGGIQEERVQARARNRVDDLVRLVAVGNEPEPSFLVVKHPAGHRNERGPEALHHADLFERRDAAIGERQVDRAPRRRRRLPGIEAALEERHAVPAPGQKDRQQRAGETGADERDFGGIAGCPRGWFSQGAFRRMAGSARDGILGGGVFTA